MFAVCMMAITVIAGLGLVRDLRAIRRGERICVPIPGLRMLCSEGE